MNFKLADLFRRVENLFREGTVIQADYKTYRFRVKIGEIETGWLRCLTLRAGVNKAWEPLSIGENVLVLSPSGELANGIILPALFTGANPAPSDKPHLSLFQFSDGAVIEYDTQSHSLNAVLPAGAKTSLVSDGGISIVGNVEITGTLTASGDVMAGSISVQNHQHTGDSGGTTGAAQ